MNLIELADKRDQKIKALENYINNLKAEQRKMDENENSEFIKLKNEVEEINKQIDEIRKADEAEKVEINTKKNKRNMNTNFSLLKTIRDISEKRTLSDETLGIINAGRRAFQDAGLASTGDLVLPFEYRTDPVLAGTQYQGQEVIAEEKFPLLNALYAKTVLGQAGATFYTGLKGDVSIPTYAGTTTYWATEVDSVTGGTGAFAEVLLTPKRLTAQISISKQFLVQESINAEQTLIDDIINSILVKVENSAFDANASSTSRPAGLFYGATLTGTTLSGATSWDKVIGVKSAVDTANALTGNLAYITHPTLAGKFETTSVDTGSGRFILENGKIAGYPVYVTSNMPTLNTSYYGLAFGNWSDFVVAQWGNGIDITIDPYSKAGDGKIVITANTYWDFKVRRSASFKLAQQV